MAYSEEKIRLLCYDVRCRRRLQKVHHYLRGQGLHLQYSVFAAKLSERRLRGLMAQISAIIDPDEDDFRAYPVPSICEAAALGRVAAPRGVVLPDEQFLRIMRPGPRRAPLSQVRA